MTLPPLSLVRQFDTHRLIPSRYSRDTVLARAADPADLDEVFHLDNLTNDRLLAGHELLLPAIGSHELVFGIRHASIINAAFTHATPSGSRFNGPDRGAWYAAFELRTSQREVAHHKAIALAEIDHFYDNVTYDDYLADFTDSFHDIRSAPAFAPCLDPDSYSKSQALARRLLLEHSPGIVYPSVRDPGGICLACFRPPIVANVRKDATYRFVWTGAPTPAISAVPDAVSEPTVAVGLDRAKQRDKARKP